MQVLRGDLIRLAFAGRFDVIVHGANCQCTMGSGIAKAIRETFPEAYDADLRTSKGDRGKLGTLSVAEVVRNDHRIDVVNAYTQFDFKGRGVRVDYDAVRRAMQAVKSRFAGKRIGYPKIGAGLAKGDWSQLSKIIEHELAGENHTLVEYDATTSAVSDPIGSSGDRVGRRTP
jgi:O-acetyl-ADP-ribose deacetylase (regulator of RNase III)